MLLDHFHLYEQRPLDLDDIEELSATDLSEIANNWSI